MQRRDFLRLVGLGAAGVALGPSQLVKAAPALDRALDGVPRTDELQVTRYAFAAFRETLNGVSAFALEAPAGVRCRAVLELPEQCPRDMACSVFAIRSGNDYAQVLLERVGRPKEPNLFASGVDACVFRTDECYCPFDGGAVTHDCPLYVDYQAMPGQGDQVLLLALWHHHFHISSCGPSIVRRGPPLEQVSDFIWPMNLALGPVPEE